VKQTKGLIPLHHEDHKGVYSSAINLCLCHVFGRHASLCISLAWPKSSLTLPAALILELLHVPRELIAQDYHISAKFGLSEVGQKQIIEGSSGILTATHWGSAPTSAILRTLELVDAKYGSIEKYLTSIGFVEEDQRRLRRLLAA
jgi:hypothetical protein